MILSEVSTGEIASATGVGKRHIQSRSNREKWPYRSKEKNGQHSRVFPINSLPSEIQTKVAKKIGPSKLDIGALCPEARLVALREISGIQETSLSVFKQKAPNLEGAIWDKKTAERHMIAQEALNVPKGHKRREWIKLVGLKYGKDRATVYKYIRKFKENGIAGLRHTNSTKGQAKAWDKEALGFWIGLVLKRAHRKISKKELYKVLKAEAEKYNWKVGGYKNACYWIKKVVTPQLLALQNGGARELDNSLPPILRNYNDLRPFEILVGDQHRFDFWVIDDETGEVFRPECYLWQDLRTRLLYGGFPTRKYNSQDMGLSLRIGVKFFGLFEAVYTDHGRPELSHYIEGIVQEIRNPSVKTGELLDYPLDLSGVDHEEACCEIKIPGEHRKAIVRNAKAKMIEGTFDVLEGALRNHFRLPGYVKRLRNSSERQDIDEQEVRRLAETGKLPTWTDFVIAFYELLAWYNNEKVHRGVIKEWMWKPKPKTATPIDCVNMCIQDGWRPTKLSDEAIDLIFLAKESMPRTVDRGRIRFHNRIYEHANLITLTGRKVNVRYDPLDPEWILVFQNGEYICRAEPVEYSSMKDQNLAQRKIHEKAKLKKNCVQTYRNLTSGILDIRNFSTAPGIEKTAALVGKDKRKRANENRGLYYERTQEELDNEVIQLEVKVQESTLRTKAKKELPERPSYFRTDLDRFKWVIKQEIAGGVVLEDDQLFKLEYESRMDEGEREHWESVRQLGAGG